MPNRRACECQENEPIPDAIGRRASWAWRHPAAGAETLEPKRLAVLRAMVRRIGYRGRRRQQAKEIKK